MVALLREFPAVKATFNLVPSLLVQVEAFAAEQAKDRHLELGLKPAASLTEEERAFCIENFFHAQRHRMIEPYPRYAELLARRGGDGSGLERPCAGAASSRWTTCATCRSGTSSSGSTTSTSSATSGCSCWLPGAVDSPRRTS